MRGLAGNDILIGGDGDDFLLGGFEEFRPSDEIFENTDIDVLFGGGGNDILRGGLFNDQLYGGLGVDILRGGLGDDSLHGGAGIDMIFGEAGADVFLAPGDDELLDLEESQEFFRQVIPPAEYVGLSESEALEQAERDRRPLRVVERDGVTIEVDSSSFQIGIFDYRVVDGFVTEVFPGTA